MDEATGGSAGETALIAVTAVPGCDGGLACGAAVAQAVARAEEGPPAAVLLAEVAPAARRRPTLVSSAAARSLEAELRGELPAAARGAFCWTGIDSGESWRDGLDLCLRTGAAVIVVYAPPAQWRELHEEDKRVRGAVIRADTVANRSLAALAVIVLRQAGVPSAVVPRAPGLVAGRRALAGIAPGGELGVRAGRIAARLLSAGPVRPESPCTFAASPRPTAETCLADERGQALPLVLAVALVLVAAGLAIALLGAAASGGARLQRAADLAAVSAARSLRDDHHRVFAPARLESGALNPDHLSEAEYRARAEAAAAEAAARNGAGDVTLAVSFGDASFAPTRVEVSLSGAPRIEEDEKADEVVANATAEAYPASARTGAGDAPANATGGGYSGPLEYRQGEGMRPDVAAAFDVMARAARAAEVTLVVNSGFRSDAEQAALFAANPDPRMVARPGTSLHRCGTELDLGPPAAYGWLAANAPRHGFEMRYGWEPWHFGFVAGPAPCSRAGDGASAGRRGPDGAGASASLPAFVPARFRGMIIRSSARSNVPIAQFMPATAAAYGLRDPLDPAASIDAQARLMADLLRQFGGRTDLALAAYNAGPAPVSACDCVPPYPETQAYVARILGLLGGAGLATPPLLEVRLVG